LPDPAAAGRAGRPVGTSAPALALTGLYGETLRTGGKPTLLLFTDPHCSPCTALLPERGRWQREHTAALTIAVLSRGAPEENRAKSAEHGLAHVLLQRDREVAEAYNVHATPGAVLVSADGTIGSPAALGADAIGRLVADVAEAPIPLVAPTLLHPPSEPQAPVAPAPALTLPDLILFHDRDGVMALIPLRHHG